MPRLYLNVLILLVATLTGTIPFFFITPSHGAPTEDAAFTIVYSSDLDGELEPCGCTMESDFGGLKRRAYVIEQLRLKHPSLILLSGGRLLDTSSPLVKLKNGFIISGILQQNYDAIGLQPKDLSFGLDILFPESEEKYIPWVATNSIPNSMPSEQERKTPIQIPSVIKITRSEYTFAYFSASTYKNAQGKQLPIDTEQLITNIQAANEAGEITILAIEEGSHELDSLIGMPFLDILIRPQRDEFYQEPLFNNNTLILSPGNRGMYLGAVTIKIHNNKIEPNPTHKIIPLDDKVPDSPRMEKWYSEYNEAVELKYKKSVEKRNKQATPIFAMNQTCKTCHPKEHDIWSGTDHSHAFKSLQKASKSFDPACIGCHVVGFNKDGGFINEFHTPALKNVQCESCHGPSLDHSQNPIETKTANTSWTMEQVCKQCHVYKHSPKFTTDSYWPRIKH